MQVEKRKKQNFKALTQKSHLKSIGKKKMWGCF